MRVSEATAGPSVWKEHLTGCYPRLVSTCYWFCELLSKPSSLGLVLPSEKK